MKLVIENLTKSYGSTLVLDDLSFSFEQGRMYGLLGRNGSGKTTLFNCIDGLIDYQQGQAYIEHDDGSREELDSHNLGLVLTDPMLPEFLTAWEFIKTFIEINGIVPERTIDEYFDLIAIDEKSRHKLIKDFSMGMKHKLQILMYLIAKPKVLLLDEPLTSLDVIVAAEIKQMLKELKGDHVIIFSTHILELATSLCDEIVVINSGKLELVDNDIIHTPEFEEKIVEILKGE
ncbi:MAG: ABC transporter ATP-binding protein [Erysipelotrichaceae bacterium]|nr:ABC transporter ATP-binding protein [Erysipelotrichaceae bacterium]